MKGPRFGSETGMTLTELLIAAAVFVIMAAGGMALLGTVVPTIRTNGQVNRVLSLMQNGREAAITKQRMHIVRFDDANDKIELIRVDAEDDEVLVESLAFEYGIQIMQFNGAPDTPDGFGNDAAVDFGNAQEVMFDSEGSFVDEDGLPRNGTVYLGIPGNVATARAVTLTGSTGRARFYIWTGDAQWEGGWLAK